MSWSLQQNIIQSVTRLLAHPCTLTPGPGKLQRGDGTCRSYCSPIGQNTLHTGRSHTHNRLDFHSLDFCWLSSLSPPPLCHFNQSALQRSHQCLGELHHLQGCGPWSWSRRTGRDSSCTPLRILLRYATDTLKLATIAIDPTPSASPSLLSTSVPLAHLKGLPQGLAAWHSPRGMWTIRWQIDLSKETLVQDGNFRKSRCLHLP